MAFLRKATLDIKSVYAADNDGKFQWRDFVKQANETPSNDRTKFLPPEAYKFDTKNFLFLTARAISGMEKHGYNGNYDAFPWEEIKKALPTYPGVGFYIEHKEDSDADAKGIVLDAIPNDDEEFAVCLCAIDKTEYPEFCQQILDGTYNQVSMSCLASTCECSKCHNVATSFDNLCEHMNPNNPITYMKGRVDENGETVYEINRDLCFTGLSAVEVPADKDAFVFDIKASKNKQSKLKEEFTKYTKIKQAGKMKEFKMACEEQFKSMSNVDLLNKLQTSANTILSQVMGNEENTDIITGPLQNILKQLMELQIGLTILDLQKLNNTTPVKEEGGQEPLTMIEDEAENFGEENQEEVNFDKEINSYLNHDEYIDEINSLKKLKNTDYDKFVEKVKQLSKKGKRFNLLSEEIVTRNDKKLFNKIVEDIINDKNDKDDWYYLLYNHIITKEDGKLFNELVDKFIEKGRKYSLLYHKIITKKDGKIFNDLIEDFLNKRDVFELLQDKIVTKRDGKLFYKVLNKAIENNEIDDLLENNIITEEELEKFKNKKVNLDKEIDSYLDGDNYSYTPFSSTASINKDLNEIIKKTY